MARHSKLGSGQARETTLALFDKRPVCIDGKGVQSAVKQPPGRLA
ncbi:MAG: hypothetical protein OXN89_12155 [Bryobacterales bacterium]|nr:hypothetical protein [Bryobacterales bacterium]